MTAVVQQQAQDVDRALDRFADAFCFQARSPVAHHPGEHGLAHEDVTFPSADGVPLEGWLIPAPGSDRLVIANHPMGFTRSGLPAHVEPWRSVWAQSGNDFEVDLVPDYKILHDAGYSVLAYDLRNHGLSGAANGGVASSGIFEARDVVGSLAFVRSRPDTQDMAVGLFSRCLGASSTFAAAAQFPETFAGVRCLVAAQPVTASVILERRLALAGLDDRLDDLDRRIALRTGIDLERRSPRQWARSVQVPTLLYQVRDDTLTEPDDVQAMFDNLPVRDKRLRWIEGTRSRFDGYLEMQRRPEPVLEWLRAHMP